jgi:hypothetical protein
LFINGTKDSSLELRPGTIARMGDFVWTGEIFGGRTTVFPYAPNCDAFGGNPRQPLIIKLAKTRHKERGKYANRRDTVFVFAPHVTDFQSLFVCMFSPFQDLCILIEEWKLHLVKSPPSQRRLASKVLTI